jgi:hypothetical protein
MKVTNGLNLTDMKLDKGEFKKMLRTIKFKIINKELNIDINRLDKRTIRRCRKLSNKGMLISGSALLRAYGLIDRHTNDIDVQWSVEEAINQKIIKWWNVINYRKYGKSTKDKRYKVSYLFFMGIDFFTNVDIFNMENLKPHKVQDDIKFGNVFVTLEKKFEYDRNKDQVDLVDIYNKVLPKRDTPEVFSL